MITLQVPITREGKRVMYSLLPVLLALVCPLGIAAMMAIPALRRRFGRTRNPAGGASSPDPDARVPARHEA